MVLELILYSLAGAFAWTFAEYGLHHWNGHLTRGRTNFSKHHLHHHVEPEWFAPAWMKVRAAAWVCPSVGLAVGSFAGLWPGVVFALSFGLAYYAYENTHSRCHFHAPTGPYSRWTRRNHFYHHFTSAKMNHGVTSPVWDLIFRTYRDPGVIRIPERHAMAWLCDPETGQVKPEYQRDYELIPERTRVSDATPTSTAPSEAPQPEFATAS